MFFVNLGNLASRKVDGTFRVGTSGLANASFVDGSTGDTVTFENLLGTVGFWTSYPESSGLYSFGFKDHGFNDFDATFQLLAAWAVRDGDVVAEPGPEPAWSPNSPDPNSVHEPGTLLMLPIGLLWQASPFGDEPGGRSRSLAPAGFKPFHE